jgi:hypothetical protein
VLQAAQMRPTGIEFFAIATEPENSQSGTRAAKDNERIRALLQDARVIHFSESYIAKATQGLDLTPDTITGFLDLPFPVVLLDTSSKFWAMPQVDSYGKPYELFFLCFLVRETSPGSCEIIGVTYNPHEPEGATMAFWSSDQKPCPIPVHIVQRLCSGIRSLETRIASEVVNRKLKFGKKRERKFIKLSRVVRVSLKKEAVPVPTYGGSMNWDICWEVRGHWRKVQTIGKDRTGNYGVPGATWVTPHIRGDKTQKPIHQLRVVGSP